MKRVVETMEGVLRAVLRLVVLTMDWVSAERDSEKEGELRSREIVDAVADLEDGFDSAEAGRGLSSTENIDKSSPFHKSPHSWLFCVM